MNNEGIDYKGRKYQKVIPNDWQTKRYANKKFGKLLVECPVQVEGMVAKPESTEAIWLTHCDCGNDYCIAMQQIRKKLKAGLIPDCGCGKRQIQDNKYIGKTYNYLTVIERDDAYKKENNYSNYNTYYKCRCKCGNYKMVRINALVSGEIKSCGCLKEAQDKINLRPNEIHDLTGQRFGKLVALSRFQKEVGGDSWWHCQCDCGNMHDVRGYSLLNGDTLSCGCLTKSHGEFIIEQILKDNNISYIYDTPYFKDLKLPSGGIGRYDFILLDTNNQPYRLIEYDGEQHYNAYSSFFGGEEELKKLQLNDMTKNQYASKHNLPLVRIPYTVKNITLETILGNEYLVYHRGEEK